jgi:hypothetical protein
MPTGYVIHARSRIVALIGWTILGLALAGLAVEAVRVFTDAGLARTIAVLVVLVGSVWFMCTKRTSLALALLMLYLGLLDGYLKLSSGSSAVTLVRDALLYAIVLGVLVRSQVEGRRLVLPPLSGWVIAYVAFVLVQIPNPSGGTLVHSLSGVRPHLEFVPLFFLGYAALRDVRSLRRFVLLLLIVAAANGIAGYIQFNLSPHQFAEWGPGYARLVNGTGVAARVFGSGGTVRVRPLGLSSDAGDGGTFGVLALAGAFALASLRLSLGYRLFAVLLGIGAITAIITSQGKAVIVAAVVTVAVYGALTATTRRRASALAGLAIGIIVSYSAVTAIVPSTGGNAYRYQGLSASKILDTASQERPGQLGAIGSAIADYPLGAGLGTAGPAAGAAGASSLTNTLNAESEFSFLVIETGVPGLVTIVGFVVVLLGCGLTRCRREPDPEAQILLAALISPLAGILVDFYVGPGTVSVPAGPFLWFVSGVIAYWLVTLPRRRRQAELAVRESAGRVRPYDAAGRSKAGALVAW